MVCAIRCAQLRSDSEPTVVPQRLPLSATPTINRPPLVLANALTHSTASSWNDSLNSTRSDSPYWRHSSSFCSIFFILVAASNHLMDFL